MSDYCKCKVKASSFALNEDHYDQELNVMVMKSTPICMNCRKKIINPVEFLKEHNYDIKGIDGHELRNDD